MAGKEKISCCSLSDAIESIALEETAIAHILNAEGEKIQKAVAEAATIDELLRVNCSVQNTLIDITALENVLFNKLRVVASVDCCGSAPIKDKGSISVYVYCCASKQPLARIIIKVYDEQMKLVASGVTDKNGVFYVGNLNNGTYSVVISHPMSQESKTFIVKITEDNKHISKQICFKSCVRHLVTIMGVVTDCNDKGLCGATVVANGVNSVTTTTDRCGRYSIRGLCVCDQLSVYAICGDKTSITYKDCNPIYSFYTCNLQIC